MNPKISIIVPVYNVEQYIHKCVDSILNQTFENFELILVDDGSTDNCGRICDEYATKDDRIVVIHKKNGGQASARNKGIDAAKGEYIGFVDSDDWIEIDMYEILYGICSSNNCDMANCSSIIHSKEKKIINGGHSLIIHDKEDAMKTMLEGKLYDEVLWSKLIKHEIFDDIRLKEGIMYEDTEFAYKLFDRCNIVACIGEPKYNYVVRDGSTMDRAKKNLSIDAVLIYNEMFDFFEKKYPDLLEFVMFKLADSSMGILNLLSKEKDFDEIEERYYKVTKILNSKYKKIVKLKKFPNTVKLLLLATKINPLLYKKIISKI